MNIGTIIGFLVGLIIVIVLGKKISNRPNIAIVFLAFIGLALFGIYKVKVPAIILPKGAQHNTFGELPIVEAMDDGDFYERDGDEYKKIVVKQKTGGDTWIN